MKIPGSILFLLILQASCSPIYSTKIEYKNPDSKFGKDCVVKCAYVRNDCYRQCQVNVTNCKLTEKVISAQERSQPLINIINNNESGNSGNSKPKQSDSNSCESKHLKCNQSCSSDITCKTQCDIYMEMCRTEQNFDRYNGYDNFISNVYGSNKDLATEKQHPVSLCQSDKCDRLCKSDYDLCFSSCGGKIITYKQCVAFCDKK
ncbi:MULTISPECIES: hypothetical protein [Ehrlichia]|uniref:Uncharacterized protein n=2 Tax=Ehrlichia muris TaxID=35795 RepID=A0A0F3NF23_9RICK|nr:MULTISPECIES: hypothetical protein [Ehrlichia]KJV65524.1 hypothetical protein EMUCRT_0468 [Ehrlichia cf. muris str. EmCRT]OUC04365.1 hypothetical protein DB91_02420 [Ehrlichia sp. Wisconsin_h]